MNLTILTLILIIIIRDIAMKGMWGKIWLNVALGLITLLAISIFIASFIFYQNYKGQDFGLFSALNAVFSGLGLVVIAFTLIYQYKQLKAQQEQFAQQNFETTFFNMLTTQRQIIDQIEFRDFRGEQLSNYKGRLFFERAKMDIMFLRNIEEHLIHVAIFANTFSQEKFSNLCISRGIPKEIYVREFPPFPDYLFESLQEIQKWFNNQRTWIDFIYQLISDKYLSNYDHYFGHLYRLLLYIRKKEDEEIDNSKNHSSFIKEKYKGYADILVSQMSTSELYVLYHNSLKYPKMQKLIKHYNILENYLKDTDEGLTLKDEYYEFYNIPEEHRNHEN